MDKTSFLTRGYCKLASEPAFCLRLKPGRGLDSTYKIHKQNSRWVQFLSITNHTICQKQSNIWYPFKKVTLHIILCFSCILFGCGQIVQIAAIFYEQGCTTWLEKRVKHTSSLSMAAQHRNTFTNINEWIVCSVFLPTCFLKEKEKIWVNNRIEITKKNEKKGGEVLVHNFEGFIIPNLYLSFVTFFSTLCKVLY